MDSEEAEVGINEEQIKGNEGGGTEDKGKFAEKNVEGEAGDEDDLDDFFDSL